MIQSIFKASTYLLQSLIQLLILIHWSLHTTTHNHNALINKNLALPM